MSRVDPVSRDGFLEVDLTSERRAEPFEPIGEWIRRLGPEVEAEAEGRGGLIDRLRWLAREHPHLLAVPSAALFTWFALALL